MPANFPTVPLSVIASWPKPNNIDPPRRAGLLPVSIVLQVLTTAFIGLRTYLRVRHQAGNLGVDDAFLILAFLASTALTGVGIVLGQHYGLGKHVWDVSFDLYEGLARCAWIAEIIFLVSTACTKMSVLLFVRGLAQGTFARRWYWAVTVAIVFTWCSTATCILSLCLSCRPLEAYWKSYDFSWTGKWDCTDTRVLNPINGALTVFSDCYSVLLPMAMLRDLKCPLRQKIALNVIFSLGLVVVAMGCSRTYYSTKLGYSYDPTWTGFDLIIWGNCEAQLSIVCASAPALRVFFRRYVRHAYSPSAREEGSGGGQIQCSLRHITDHTHRGPSQEGDRPSDDRPLTKVQPSVDSILADDDEGEEVIRNPAEYEAYNLRNLEKIRPSLGILTPRPQSP